MQCIRFESVPKNHSHFSLNPVLIHMYCKKTCFGKNTEYLRYTTFLTKFKSYIYVITKEPLYVKFQVQLRYNRVFLGFYVHFVKIMLRQFFKSAYN